LEFYVTFQHKYGYIRDKKSVVVSYPYPVKINICPTTIRSVWHSPANYVDSAWDDQPFQRYGWCPLATI